jgi:hypothetical protein
MRSLFRSITRCHPLVQATLRLKNDFHDFLAFRGLERASEYHHLVHAEASRLCPQKVMHFLWKKATRDADISFAIYIRDTLAKYQIPKGRNLHAHNVCGFLKRNALRRNIQNTIKGSLSFLGVSFSFLRLKLQNFPKWPS